MDDDDEEGDVASLMYIWVTRWQRLYFTLLDVKDR